MNALQHRISDIVEKAMPGAVCDDNCLLNYVRVTTPLLDSDDNNIKVYVKSVGDTIEITDDGYYADKLMEYDISIDDDGVYSHIKRLCSDVGIDVDITRLRKVTDAEYLYRDFPTFAKKAHCMAIGLNEFENREIH